MNKQLCEAAQATSGSVQPGMESFLAPQQSESDNGRPRAYLNWVLLDEEQLKAVQGNQRFVHVPLMTEGVQKQVLQAAGGGAIEITRNGFLYVYVSNESK